ncbi:hypothetical protein ACIQU5_01325 [Streptomyces sp. NPDC090306]|uniref:hypothetical protein n=1 Tax=unclassified Streptomyces TaxID=2593676 RepID=UPI0036EE3B09
MNTTHTQAVVEGLLGTAAVLGILALVILPSLIGIAHERRVDRQIREARAARQADAGQDPDSTGRERTQKSSSRSTVPSTATWYAEGRRSKKLVSS